MNTSKFWLHAIAMFLCAAVMQAQTPQTPTLPKKKKKEVAVEVKHKNTDWYRKMHQPGANYLEVKRDFENYFKTNEWRKTMPRQACIAWLRSNIAYLDKNGNVQAPPAFVPQNSTAPTLAKSVGTTRDAGSWHMIGPVNTQSPNGNEGGYVVLTRIDPTNPQKIFASFQWGGLWMTTDGGTTWTLTDANMPDLPYNDLDVAISNPNIVYAISASHVIKSTDGGSSWNTTALTSTSYSGAAYDIAVSTSDPNIVVARWDDKIYRTADGGTTWTPIVTGLPGYNVWEGLSSEMLDWSLTDNNVVYLLSTSDADVNYITVYRSGDAGATFSIINTLIIDTAAEGTAVGWGKILQGSNNTNEFYVAMGTGGSHYGHHAGTLYKLNRTTGAEVLKRVNFLSTAGSQELHHGDIAMDKTDENKIVFGTYGEQVPHYSTNNGASFTVSASNVHSDQRSLDMKNNKLAIGNDGQVAISNDGGITNTGITNTISNHELWGFGAAFKSAATVAGTNHGPAMVRESGLGFEWTTLSGADQGNTDINPLDENYVYSQGYDNYLYYRTGFGTYYQVPNQLDEGGIYSYFNNFEFHPNLYYTLITHHAGGYPVGNPNLNTWKNSLIRSDDNGANINVVKTFTDQLYREKICMTNPDYIYTVVGLSNNKVWKTTDGGTTWTDVTPTVTESSGEVNISDIAVSDVDPNQVWITYSGVQTVCKVLKTANGGTSWTNLTQPILTANPNTKIIFQRGSDGGVYVGNKSGVYYRNNSMVNWAMLGSGLVPLEIRFMFINYNLGKLRIGTSRGAWEHDLYETNAPKAQISASTNVLTCTGQIVQFKDYSTVRNASAIWAWSFPGGTPSTSNLENPQVTYSGANGFYNVSLTVTDAYGTSSQTLTNFIHLNAPPPLVLPITENFENAFPPASLTTNGGWAQDTTVGGFGTSSKCAYVNNYYFSSHTNGTVSMFTKPVLLASGATSSYLTFDVAYAKWYYTPDTLTVSVSTDCGATYTELYKKGGDDLSTTGYLEGGNFVPTASQWRTDSVNINAYAGQQVRFKITDTKFDGNNLYLDNLNINQVGGCTLPAQSSVITKSGGTPKVCPGDSRTYSVINVQGLTYNWTLPAGATFQSGQGTNQVVVNYNGGFTTQGYITVTANNNCGASPPRQLLVKRNDPSSPGAITGLKYGVCSGTGVSYLVPNVAGMTYNWSFSSTNASVATGQGTNSITADYNNSYTTGNLSVTANNTCGTSVIRKIVVRATPAQPAISGAGFVCENQQAVPYSIAPVATATTYTWKGPVGSKISDGVNTSLVLTTTSTSVTVNFKTTAGDLTVRANNACGCGTKDTLPVAFNCKEAALLQGGGWSVACYPVPANDELNVSFLSDKAQVNIIRICDAIGKTVLNQNNKSTVGENYYTLDVSTLDAGIYFIMVVNGKESSIQKIVIE